MECALSAGSLSSCGGDHCFMDSTSKSTEEKSLAKTKTSRGMFVKACVAKAMTWELELVKALPMHDGIMSETPSS